MTTVKAELEFLRKLPDFQNIRVTVGITDTVREDEKTGDAFERVYALVEKKLVEKVEQITKEML